MEISTNHILEKEAGKVIDDLCGKGRGPTRKNILDYENFAKSLPQICIPVKHTIHGGMYAREITIPKGTFITGQIYKFDHLDIMLSGDITVSTEDGESKRINGHNVFQGESGKKRAGYAHENTTWITIHPYGENISDDGDKIQAFLTAETFQDLELFYQAVNRNDYEKMVMEMDLTEQEIRAVVENKDDVIDMPIGFDGLIVKASSIDGVGLFTDDKISKDTFVCPARINGMRTPAGRYVNHAFMPNCKILVGSNGLASLFSIKSISEGEELTINYQNTISHRALVGDLCQE